MSAQRIMSDEVYVKFLGRLWCSIKVSVNFFTLLDEIFLYAKVCLPKFMRPGDNYACKKIGSETKKMQRRRYMTA